MNLLAVVRSTIGKLQPVIWPGACAVIRIAEDGARSATDPRALQRSQLSLTSNVRALSLKAKALIGLLKRDIFAPYRWVNQGLG